MSPFSRPASFSSRPSRRVRRSLATVALASLTLAGCAGIQPYPRATFEASGSQSHASAGPIPQGLESFYTQDVNWYPCAADAGMEETSSSSSFDCAFITVPMSYSAPDGETIGLALKRRHASGTAQGSLVTNPGGPGGSGVEFVENIDAMLPGEVTAAFDVVSFDPRGVGNSTAIDCLTDAQLDSLRAGDDLPGMETVTQAETPAQAAEAQGRWMREHCEASTQPTALLDSVDTMSAARDLDVIRALLNSPQLTYLGYSYGTYLGATYADLFPGNVGRMVLDGALDPSLNANGIVAGQAAGFEASLRAFVEDCQSGKNCPLRGDVDAGVTAIQSFLSALERQPLATAQPGRSLTKDLAISGIIGPLYQPEANYVLSMALDQAMNEQDGTLLLRLADIFASRDDDGHYSSNGDEAINIINCLDYPVEGDEAIWDEQAEHLRDLSPTFGDSFGYSDAGCRGIVPQAAHGRGEIHAAGAAPIVVIGTTGDPATPYAWAQALAEQLDSARLVTWRGWGHTAYGRADACLNDPVSDYLLTGALPQEGLTCGSSGPRD